MASLAFGIAGAGVGSLFGMPSLGFSVGSTLGGLLFPTKQPNTFGPQMGDLSVTSSAYGADIPYGFGTMRISGNIIWASPIQEVANTSKPSKGKGKGGKDSGGKTTVYTYYGNFAVGFAHGPAESVTRIWLDGVLVYDTIDAGGIAPTAVPNPVVNGNQRGNFIEAGATTYPGLNFRFYKGDEKQVADPLIEAWIAIGDVSPAGTKAKFKSGTTPSTPAGEPPVVEPGSQAVPGHRGLCYIVFENWCLTNSGNHIPMVTAEISFGVAPNYPYLDLLADSNPATNSGQGGATYGAAGTAVDLLRHTGFRVSYDGTYSYIREFDTDSMNELLIKKWTDVSAVPGDITGVLGEILNIIMGLDGFLYVFGPGTDSHSNRNVIKIDPNSIKEKDRANIAPYYGLVFPGGRFYWGMASGIGDDEKLDFWLILGLYDGGMIIVNTGNTNTPMAVNLDGNGDFFTFHPTAASEIGNVMWGAVPDPTKDNVLTAYAVGMWGPLRASVGDPVEIYSIEAIASVVELLSSFSLADFLAEVDVAPTDTAGGMLVGHGLWADASTSSVIFGIRTITGADTEGADLLVSYSLVTFDLNWVTNLTAAGTALPGDTGNSIQSFILNHKLAWGTAPGAVEVQTTEINTLDGSVTKVIAWPAGTTPVSIDGQDQVYDGYTDSIIVGSNSIKIYIGRAQPADTTVGVIVRAMSALVGLNSTDLDTTDVDDVTIKGYFIGQPTSVRDAILPLAQAYLFDAVESDGVIKFPKRGKSVVRTLTQAHDLAPVDQKSNLVLLETRAQEVDLPIYLAVSYYDGNNNYQQGTRIRRRSQVPLQNDPFVGQNAPTAHTQNVSALQWPIVLDAQTAAEAADKYFFATWLERTTFKQKLHWGHIDLDPSDVIKVVLADGTTYEQRLTKLVLGGDLSIECDACSENSAVYDSTAKGGDDFRLVQTGYGSAFTKLLLLPTPLLKDSVSAGQENSVLFYAASNYGSNTTWPGCSVVKSTDLEIWTTVDSDPYKAKWGSTGTVLPDAPDPFSWDDTSTLLVVLRNNETLENATDAEILTGDNAMAVFNKDGNPEVIQFGTAIRNADGSYTISHLLRGRRGTDSWTRNHGVGQEVVLLDDITTRSFTMSLSDLTQTRYYKGIGAGLSINFADLESLSSPGNDLKPYAPVHDAASRPSNWWDTAFDAANLTFAAILHANDQATHALTNGTFCIAHAKDPFPTASKTYLETSAFGAGGTLVNNSTGWGVCDSSMAVSGTQLGADSHGVLFRDALHLSGTPTRLSFAVNTITNRGWYREDNTSWKGAGGGAGDPVAGTNGIDLSSPSGSLFMAFSTVIVGEACAIYTSAADLVNDVPLGYTAGIPGADIVLSWTRRTRLGGELHNNTGVVPLSEASEGYDVEILSGPGGSVVRTILGVAGPTATYTSAQYTSDFGARPAQLTLRVYQLSAVVGRGFTVEQTVIVS